MKFDCALMGNPARTWHCVCRQVFKTIPLERNIPDYYSIVDRQDVRLLPSLSKLQYPSRQAVFENVDQLRQNAEAYNVGCDVPNKRWKPGSTEPQFVRVGPGNLRVPGVALLARAFAERVHQYLARPDKAEQVCHLTCAQGNCV